MASYPGLPEELVRIGAVTMIVDAHDDSQCRVSAGSAGF